MRSIVFVLAHDSEFKWAAPIAAFFRNRECCVRYFAPKEYAKIGEAQILDAGLDPAEVITGPIISYLPFLANQDAVIIATPGGITERIIYQLRDLAHEQSSKPRPVIVTTYVGLVIDSPVGGFLRRAPADIVCVNSQHDLDLFKRVCLELRMDGHNLLLSGLPILPQAIKPQQIAAIKKVVFADQVIIPKDIADRKYLYQKLLEYAALHPDRAVIVKPRHRPGEGGFRRCQYPPEHFFAKRSLPKNIYIDYSPIKEILSSVNLLLTVSSTAALEAIAEGIPVSIISDTGVREANGNQLFVGSGLIRSFSEIMADEIGSPRPEWMARFQHTGQNSSEVIFAAVAAACAKRDDGALDFVASPYFFARQALFRDCYGFYSEHRSNRGSRRRLLNEATARLSAGNWTGALDVSMSALSRTPDSTQHMRVAAAALRRLGRLDDAFGVLKRARRLRPRDRRLRSEHTWLKRRLFLRRVLRWPS